MTCLIYSVFVKYYKGVIIDTVRYDVKMAEPEEAIMNGGELIFKVVREPKHSTREPKEIELNLVRIGWVRKDKRDVDALTVLLAWL